MNKKDSIFKISKHTTKISDEHLTKWTSTKKLVDSERQVQLLPTLHYGCILEVLHHQK
jgi:hypothetical protein